MNNYFNIYKIANIKKEPWQMTKSEFLAQEKSLRDTLISMQDFWKEHEPNLKAVEWQPLYQFLKKAGNDSLSWAHGFTYFGKWKHLVVSARDAQQISWAVWRENDRDFFGIPNKGERIKVNADFILMYQYKHGISRRTLSVDANGELYSIVYGSRKLPITIDEKLLRHVEFIGMSIEEVLECKSSSILQTASDDLQEEVLRSETLNRIYREIDKGDFGNVNRDTRYNQSFIEKRNQQLIDTGMKLIGPGDAGIEVKNEATTHHREVEKALREGLPVPEDVLMDYPDLRKKYRV